jgi:hypothetical protein
MNEQQSLKDKIENQHNKIYSNDVENDVPQKQQPNRRTSRMVPKQDN